MFPWGIDAGGYHTWAVAQLGASVPLPSQNPRLVAIVLGVSMPVAIVVARLDAGDPLPSHGVLMPVAIVLGRSLSLAQVFPSLLGGW